MATLPLLHGWDTYIYIYVYNSLSLSLYIYIHTHTHIHTNTREREREREKLVESRPNAFAYENDIATAVASRMKSLANK